jgi:hypothetical protein
MAESKSAWFYVGIGCLVLFVVGALVAIAGGFWAVRTARQFQAELEDPDARTAKALRVLGADSVPEGYHAVIGFSVPFLMDVAILSDEPPGPDGQPSDLGKRSLIYVQIIRAGMDEAALRDYFSGKTSDPAVLRESNINVDADEIIGRGVIERDDADLMYLAQRGRVSTAGYTGSGVTSIVLIDCPQDDRARMAIWSEPDERPGVTAAEIDWTGTTADPVEIERFLASFRFCGAR